MRDSLPAFLIGAAGLVLLAALSLQPQADTAALAVVLPVWAAAAALPAAIDRLDLAIVDLRLAGRMVVLRPRAAGDARSLAAQLRQGLPAGTLILAADARLCGTLPPRSGG